MGNIERSKKPLIYANGGQIKMIRQKDKRNYHGFINDCPECNGYGFMKGAFQPLYESEAFEGYESDPCTHCGSDNDFFAEQKKKRDANKSIAEDLRSLYGVNKKLLTMKENKTNKLSFDDFVRRFGK